MEVKFGGVGCRGDTIGPGTKPNRVALLSDEIHAWRFLQSRSYKRQGRIQWAASTTQLLSTWRVKKGCQQTYSRQQSTCSLGNRKERNRFRAVKVIAIMALLSFSLL